MCVPLGGGSMPVPWSPADDSKSSDLVACTRRASEGFQVGNWEGDDSHEGPCLHSVESANC